MSKIIAEIENTLSGTILVVKNENGTFSMGPLDENGVFSENPLLTFWQNAPTAQLARHH